MTFRPLFNLGQIGRGVQATIDQGQQRFVEAMSFIGEEFINRARNSGDYTDRTGNLRASVFYAVLVGGRVEEKQIMGSSEDNAFQSQSEQLLNELAPRFSQGIVLIVGAGMEYAAYVEANGKDVLTGSAPNRSAVRRDLQELLN